MRFTIMIKQAQANTTWKLDKRIEYIFLFYWIWFTAHYFLLRKKILLRASFERSEKQPVRMVVYLIYVSKINSSLSFRCATRRLCRRKKGEWTLDLFFLTFGQSPNVKKNKSSVHSPFFRRQSRRVAHLKLNELLY